MCVRYLGFVLLIWFPGVLHARSAAQPCSPPSLDGGYVVPLQDTYPHDSTVTYGCDKERKPAVDGWWATMTCQNGRWSPNPQCVDRTSCPRPNIPHGEDTVNQDGWYKADRTLAVTCDAGYELKGELARCVSGEWSALPVCEKTTDACSKPDKIPHAVIIHQEYKEVFAAGSEVQYECEQGFTAEGATRLFCRDGNWTEGPACNAGTTGPAGGTPDGSSATSGSNDGSPMRNVEDCGDHPTVPNAAVADVQSMFVKYRCDDLYSHVGLDFVTCFSDKTWSQLPSCKKMCVMDPAQYSGLSQTEHIEEGKVKSFSCSDSGHLTFASCTDGVISTTRCCSRDEIKEGRCQ